MNFKKGAIKSVGVTVATPLLNTVSAMEKSTHNDINEDRNIINEFSENEEIIYVDNEQDFQKMISMNPDNIIKLIPQERYGKPQKTYIPGSRIEKQTGIKFITGSSAADSIIVSVVSKMCKMNFWTALGFGATAGLVTDAASNQNARLKSIVKEIGRRKKTGVITIVTPNPIGYPEAKYTFERYY